MNQMTSHRARCLRRTVLAACLAMTAAAPAALAQSAPPTGVGPVDTIVGSLSGGVEQPPAYVCDQNRPEVRDIIAGTRDAFDNIFPNITAMAARGYLPYVDAPLFGLSGRQGHWLNPNFIGDKYPKGHPKEGQPRLMDPKRPEGILVDRWNRPIGAMFIADDPYVPGPNLYMDNETNVACNAWHYHTETLADAYWYAYKYGYSGDIQEGDIEPPDRTPDLMHVWRYGEYKYQFNHKAPPQDQMPGDPDSVEDVQSIVGGPRVPGMPPPPGR